ncbi:hypothetical protein V3C99_003555 [Haemonchus contortus]
MDFSVWEYLKSEIAGRSYRMFDAQKLALQKAWDDIDVDYLRRTVDSVIESMKACGATLSNKVFHPLVFVRHRHWRSGRTEEAVEETEEAEEAAKSEEDSNAMKSEGEAGNTGKPMAVDPGVEIYRGRSPGPYVPGTSWRTWWKLFNNFLVLRKVTEEKDQRLIFLQEVGNSNYELLESLLQGRELEDVELKDLRQAMERHYQPKKLILAERFGLMSKVQKPGQALHEYYAELQKAANSCNFEEIKNYRDAVVTMVFIGGLLSVETRKRLLEKEELTSKEALEQAEAFERVGENAPHLKEGPQAAGVAQKDVIIRGDLAAIRSGRFCIIRKGTLIRPSSKKFSKGVTLFPVHIGDHVMIEEDCVISAAQICSFVHIGAGSVIGGSAVLKECCRVLPGSVVAADSVFPPYSTIAGNPARVIGQEPECTEDLMTEATKQYYDNFQPSNMPKASFA